MGRFWRNLVTGRGDEQELHKREICAANDQTDAEVAAVAEDLRPEGAAVSQYRLPWGRQAETESVCGSGLVPGSLRLRRMQSACLLPRG
jgi:hypothetical protein